MQKMVVVGVVHDLNLAYQFANNLVLINKGEVISKGNRSEVFTKENMVKTFNIETSIIKDKNGNEYLVYQSSKME